MKPVAEAFSWSSLGIDSLQNVYFHVLINKMVNKNYSKLEMLRKMERKSMKSKNNKVLVMVSLHQHTHLLTWSDLYYNK